MNLIESSLGFLQCPDDKGDLFIEHDKIVCTSCNRIFKTYKNCIIDLRPTAPSAIPNNFSNEIEKRYWKNYMKLFTEELDLTEPLIAWGAKEVLSSKDWEIKIREFNDIKNLINENMSTYDIAIDISAGNGIYPLDFADKFKVVFSCDLWAKNINYVSGKIEQNMIKNILVIRCDHLKSPFKKNIADLTIATDTLIYGPKYDMVLLNLIIDLLKKGGNGIVDFANFYHNPFGRHTYKHTKHELKKMFSKYSHKIVPFYNGKFGMYTHLLPPTRMIVSFFK